MAFLISAFWQLEGASLVLVVIVSSRMLTDMYSMRTMSGLATKVLMLIGIVAGGESNALHVWISAYQGYFIAMQ